MKRLLVLTCAAISLGAQEIEYSTSGGMTEERFAGFKEKYNCDTFIETGTLTGYTTRRAAPFFKNIYTIELHDGNYIQSRKNLKEFTNIDVIHGRSEIEMRKILKQHGAASTLIFLDAHYSAGGTAKAKNDPPVNDELCVLLPHIQDDTVIILDDVRCFCSDFTIVIRGYYPHLRDIKNYVEKNFKGFGFYIIGDQALIYNPEHFNDIVSPGVKLLTELFVTKSKRRFLELARSIPDVLSDREKTEIMKMANAKTLSAMISFMAGVLEKTAGNEAAAEKYFLIAFEQGLRKEMIDAVR